MLGFTSGATANPINENSGAGQEVYRGTATDQGSITWSIGPGGDAAAFSIVSNTGRVTLNADPDFESQSSYTFTVVATDNAGNTSQQVVTLDINNVDEVAPTITSLATATAIDENSGAGQVVYTVTSDDTRDISGGVTYSLAATGDGPAFSIDTHTASNSSRCFRSQRVRPRM